jgi:hypothetical protein
MGYLVQHPSGVLVVLAVIAIVHQVASLSPNDLDPIFGTSDADHPLKLVIVLHRHGDRYESTRLESA